MGGVAARSCVCFGMGQLVGQSFISDAGLFPNAVVYLENARAADLIKYTFEHYQEQIFLASLASSEHCKEAEGRTRVIEAVTVLIVEDDQLIQGMVEEALSDGGFKSVITGSGEEAVALLQANESIYRAIVTDINLLGTIDGWEVARCAREIDPALPVIYMTGTHGEDWPSRGLPNSVLLTKPFAPAQLVTAISNLLNAASPPSSPAA